jgi:hypothetical protein
MGHVWIQVLTRSPRDRSRLTSDFRPKQLAEDILAYETRIRRRPDDATLRDDIALMYLALHKPRPAIARFEAALGDFAADIERRLNQYLQGRPHVEGPP